MTMSDTGNQDQGGQLTDQQIVGYFANQLAGAGTDQGQIQYPMPARVVIRGSRGTGVYTGPNLVDENNRVTNQTAYDTSESYAKFIWGSLTPASRQQVLDTLDNNGFYGGGRSYVNDINAIQMWLDYSNTLGVTSNRALMEMQKNPVGKGSGGGSYRPRFRVSAAEDLKVVANQVAKQTLGREFTTDEAAKFVSAYQQREVQSQQAAMGGGTFSEAPSADVFAQQYAQQVAPTEANGYKFLGYMNKIFSAIGGR
jgi:hypothetical protein